MEVRDKRIMQKAGIETILRAEIDKLQKELDDKMALLKASQISTRMSERIVALVEGRMSGSTFPISIGLDFGTYQTKACVALQTGSQYAG